jgi:hypothetical protein
MSSATSTSIFFDPWIDSDYYAAVIPVLPLLYDRVFIYYPSDRWAATSLNPLAQADYRENYLYWIQRGVLVPVVQGNYPVDRDISPTRAAEDGPTDGFTAELKRLRRTAEEHWIVLERGATQRGRESADALIRTFGDAEFMEALRFEPQLDRLPDLAYFYAGGATLSTRHALRETVGTYENDDWIRAEYRLGEYLLPSVLGYQYRSLKLLMKERPDHWIFHRTAGAFGFARHLNRRHALASAPTWVDRDKIDRWRDLGLHTVLRRFLHREINRKLSVQSVPPVEAESSLSNHVATQLGKLQEKLPTEVLTKLKLNEFFPEIVGVAAGSLIGAAFAEGNLPAELADTGVGYLVGASVGYVLGKIGERWVYLSPLTLRWDELIDMVEQHFGSSSAAIVEEHILSFEDVRILA